MKEGNSTTDRYSWTWGDASHVEFGNKTQSHTYIRPGSYDVSVAFTENGETFSVQKSILVLGNINIEEYLYVCYITIVFR